MTMTISPHEPRSHRHNGLTKAFIKRAMENNRIREIERRKRLQEEQKKSEQFVKNYKSMIIREAGDPKPIYRSNFQKIIQRICAVTGISRNEIFSQSREKHTVFARQAIMYWAARLTNHSYPLIGKLLGGKDHTTILHGVKTYQKKRANMGRKLKVAR